MHYQIINQEHEIVGYTNGEIELLPGYRLQAVQTSGLNDALLLDNARNQAITNVKNQAKAWLEDSLWRIERAQEREWLGILEHVAGESLNAVYREREAIRRASNRAEQEIMALESPEAVLSYVFSLQAQDYPTSSKITRLALMRRLSAEERQSLDDARKSDRILDDFMKLLALAQDVDINDPDLQTALYYLEEKKWLKKGRAKAILQMEELG